MRPNADNTPHTKARAIITVVARAFAFRVQHLQREVLHLSRAAKRDHVVVDVERARADASSDRIARGPRVGTPGAHGRRGGSLVKHIALSLSSCLAVFALLGATSALAANDMAVFVDLNGASSA